MLSGMTKTPLRSQEDNRQTPPKQVRLRSRGQAGRLKAGSSRRDKFAGNEWKWADIYTAPAVGTGVQAARGGQVLGIGGKNVLTAWQEEEVVGCEMTGELVHGSRQETARAGSWLTS